MNKQIMTIPLGEDLLPILLVMEIKDLPKIAELKMD